MSESREVLDERFRDFVTKFLNELPKPFPERVRIGTIALVAEIERLDDAGEVETSEVWYRCSDPRPWVQSGLLRAAMRVADFDDHDDDDEPDADE